MSQWVIVWACGLAEAATVALNLWVIGLYL
jgi:hypothetical protein